MTITLRQEDILSRIVEEYIASAQPVSSQLLQQEYDFGVSPATIRNDMSELTEQGFVVQPYTSAGRIPTEKGYRRFVDSIQENRKRVEQERGIKELIDYLTTASGLGVVYYQDVLWKEGWEGLLDSPEFRELDTLRSLSTFLYDFEEYLESAELGENMEVFIGSENPFSEINDFSILLLEHEFSEREHAIVAVIGPKRMQYQKNIRLLQSL